MEKPAILKKDLHSRVTGERVPKGTMVIYSSTMNAIRLNTKSNRSDLWIGVRESHIEIIDWVEIK